MRRLGFAAALLVAATAAGCGSELDVFTGPIDCGPITDPALCKAAIAVALTAKTNPPPMAGARIRIPDAGDDCATWFHACGDGSVIVVIQSGDTLEDVPIQRSADGWVRLDQVR